jgi:UrcA family protein
MALGLVALATVTAVGAQAQAGNSDIVARGTSHRLGWITTMGPDAAGRTTVAIDIAGIDPATPEGWARMARRVDHGVGTLCDKVGAAVWVAGYHDPVRESCLNEGRADAQVQMEQARAAALRGQKVATLGLNYSG